jgi:hypothetical protein
MSKGLGKLKKKKILTLPHSSATRFKDQEQEVAFPSLETVIFVTDFGGKILVTECFTHNESEGLKTFNVTIGHLILPAKGGVMDMGRLLYASGLTDMADYLLNISAHREVVFVPAIGGRLAACL